MIDVKLAGVWETVKAAVPQLISQCRGGPVALTSSVGGLKAYPRTCHYIVTGLTLTVDAGSMLK